MRKLYSIIAIVIVIFLIIKPKHGKQQWTVYGTNSCGWTRKQLEYMKEKGIPHNYIECDKNNCGNIREFPTMKDPSGKLITGYSLI